MLVGNFKHTIDAKGRVFLPAKFRDDLGASVLIIKGSNNCLTAFSEVEWKKITEEMTASLDKATVANAKRELMKKSQLVEPDAQGRIIISSEMREMGFLTKDIVFLGMDNCVEIWDNDLLYGDNEENDTTTEFIRGMGL